MGIIHVDFETTVQLLIIYSAFAKHVGRKSQYNEAVHQLFIDVKESTDSVRREVLYNFLIQFGISMKLVRLIKLCLNETFRTVRVGKHLCNEFRIRNCLKQRDVLSPLLFNFALEYAIRTDKVKQEGSKLNGTKQL